MYEMEGPRPVLRHNASGCPTALRHSTYYQGQ
jgi:hypothetical protein